MRREAAFRCSVVGDLHRQLEWASADARLRLLDAAEQLIREIDLDRGYPVEFVTFRLTAWKSDGDDVVETVAGEALLADLVTMIQRVSRRCALPLHIDGSSALLLDDVSRLLGVSQRTLVRMRRRGLAMRYVQCNDGRLRLGCRVDVLAWFKSRWSAQTQAGPSTSIEQDSAQDIVDAAQSLSSDMSLPRLVDAMALKFRNRSASSIRSVLRRGVDRGDLSTPVQRRLRDRDGQFAWRADRRGIPVRDIAARLGVGGSAVHRAVIRWRRRQIVAFQAVLPPALIGQDVGDEEALSPACVNVFLGQWSDAFVLSPQSTDIPHLEAMLVAMHVLRRRFGVIATEVCGQPAAGQIDRAETDLRWMTQLRFRLVMHLASSLTETIQQWCSRAPETLSLDMQRVLLRRGLAVCKRVVERHPAGEASRLAARARVAVDRNLAEMTVPRSDLATSRLRTPPTIPLSVSEVWRDVLPDPAWIARVDTLLPSQRELVVARWGFCGQRPRTLQDIAHERGSTVPALARAWVTAQQQLARPNRTN
jgi:hypothetical protein